MIHPTNAKKFFLLLDLDGTLVDTDAIHVRCYEQVGAPKENLAYALRRGELNVSPEMKAQKARCVEDVCQREGVQWMPGAQELLQFCNDYTVNYCIVTNTPRKPVEAMCAQLSLLHKANQEGRLLCREDYAKAKPHSDGYLTAIHRFYTQEDMILGFENTYLGWCALNAVEISNIQNYLVNGTGDDKEDVKQRGGNCIPSLKIITENT